MKNYINKISVLGNENRKNEICKILEEIGVEYKVEGENCKNIIVSKNNTNKKLVIGAHYDAAQGSFGANDNGAACVILLNIIEELKDSEKSMEFIFFDKEETFEKIGSREYVKKYGKDVEAFINLDMCGMGKNIVCTYANYNNMLKKEPYNKIIENCINVRELPSGDYDSFAINGIPSIYIINSTDSDLSWFKNMENPFQGCDFFQTMHNPTDKPDTFSDYGMNMIFDYLIKYLK